MVRKAVLERSTELTLAYLLNSGLGFSSHRNLDCSRRLQLRTDVMSKVRKRLPDIRLMEPFKCSPSLLGGSPEKRILIPLKLSVSRHRHPRFSASPCSDVAISLPVPGTNLRRTDARTSSTGRLGIRRDRALCWRGGGANQEKV